MTQLNIAYYYDVLKQNHHLSDNECALIKSEVIGLHQLASLAILLARRARNQSENELLNWIVSKSNLLERVVKQRYPQSLCTTMQFTSDWLCTLFSETHFKGNIGNILLKQLIQKYLDESLPIEIVAAWLMVVCMEGLSVKDVQLLTLIMRDSGSIFDYRDSSTLRGYSLVRRYPTGALSEKTALILPSLLAAAHEEFKIVSPFLISHSLSFTGGTWDKLSAIPGFYFPTSGEETIEALKNCGVAMTVTHGNLNPADKLMYQLRSVTGTVESEALIVASIASKHLAVPAHRLLMDIRYGEGAFLKNVESAKSLGIQLQKTISEGGVPTFCHFTNTEQPGGASIGNALEVAEAIAILGGKSSEYWDIRWIYEQKALVIDFFCKIMASVYPHQSTRYWASLGDRWLNDGTAINAFKQILNVHKVDVNLSNRIVDNPFSILGISQKPVEVRATKNGVLSKINQRGLGNFVNLTLGGGGNHYLGNLLVSNGLIISKRLGDPVQHGDILCYIFSSTSCTKSDIDFIRSYFFIEN